MSMKADSSYRCIASLWLASILAASFVGCQRRPATAEISGKVLYKDGSVPNGGVRVVRFEPTPDSPAEIRKTASSEIRDDGSFELYTRRPGDGVFLGKYAVTFTVWKGPRDKVSLIDPVYTTSANTPYTFTVDGDKDGVLFEIEPLSGREGGAQ
jgi:hypothetical protein